MNQSLNEIYQDLRVEPIFLKKYKLQFCDQAPLENLVVVDIDFSGRPFILLLEAATAWARMYQSAIAENILLEPASGFRSFVHQKNLIKQKLAKGLSLADVLQETALPGYSEHHSGCAVDICTDGRYELCEAFEKTAAFAWLSRNAERFDFFLSYPRENALGIQYEPWHWCWKE